MCEIFSVPLGFPVVNLIYYNLQPSSSRGSSLRDEGKSIGKDSAAVDPPGLQEQVCNYFSSSSTSLLTRL
jgi:hypothetical protein